MAITVYTEDQIFNATMAFFRAVPAFQDKDLSEFGFLGLIARAFAQAVVLIQKAIEDADKDAVPAYQQDADGELRSRTSTQALDDWAFVFGLPSDTPGIYGRKGARVSSGGAGIPAANAGGILIPALSLLTDGTGRVTIQTTADVTTDGPPNTLAVSLTSITKGVAANLPVGTVLTFASPPPGVTAQLTLTAALSGGRDRESDVELLDRLLRRIQNPPRGGTAADYRVWAEEAVDANGQGLGIVRACVYPLRGGLGTVDILPLVAGTGITRKPGTGALASLLAYLNGKRPVTAKVNILEARMLLALRVRVRVEAKEKFAYDWNDGAVANIIDAYNLVGTPKKIQLRLPAPALKAAVDLGQRPRVQIICSAAGASSRPYQLRVVAYTSGPPDEITLEGALPEGLSPVIGTDYLYAGGPVVEPAALEIDRYINEQVLPSRQSGYADENDPWEYKVSLARVIDLVMDVKDTDGTKMVANIPNAGTGGVVIAVGGGAFAAADHEPRDVLGAPELAFLRAGGIEIVRAP